MMEGINALKHHHVGLEECHGGVWSVYLGTVLVGASTNGRRRLAVPKAVDT